MKGSTQRMCAVWMLVMAACWPAAWAQATSPAPPPGTYPPPPPACPPQSPGFFIAGACTWPINDLWLVANSTNGCATYSGQVPVQTAGTQCTVLAPLLPGSMLTKIVFYTCEFCLVPSVVGLQMFWADGSIMSAGSVGINASIITQVLTPSQFMNMTVGPSNSPINFLQFNVYSSATGNLLNFQSPVIGLSPNPSTFYPRSGLGSGAMAGALVYWNDQSPSIRGLAWLFLKTATFPPIPASPPPYYYPPPYTYNNNAPTIAKATMGAIIGFGVLVALIVGCSRMYCWTSSVRDSEELGNMRADASDIARQPVYPDPRPRRARRQRAPAVPETINNNTVYFGDTPPMSPAGTLNSATPGVMIAPDVGGMGTAPAAAASAGTSDGSGQATPLAGDAPQLADIPTVPAVAVSDVELAEKRKEVLKVLDAAAKEQGIDDKPVAGGDGGEEATGMCVVCLSEKSVHAFLPCGHLCCCNSCITRVSQTKKCPVCRSRTSGYTHVFMC